MDQGRVRDAERDAVFQLSPVSLEYLRAAKLVMEEHNIANMPGNIDEALNLYFTLITEFDNYV